MHCVGRQLGRTEPAREAFTLTELLVTISIAAFLLLIGVGVYWRISRGFALRAAVSTLESSLRGARAFAVHERSRAEIVLVTRPLNNPDDGYTHEVDKLYVLGKRTVSCWHFESSQIDGTTKTVKGALDQAGALTGTYRTEQGRVGKCLVFDRATSTSTSTSISVSSPYLDEVREGVFVDAYVRPDAKDLADGYELPIASKGAAGAAAFSLSLVYQPSGLFWLEGSVRTKNRETDQIRQLKAHTAATIRAGEWSHVALEYNHDGERDSTDDDGNLLGPGIVLRINGREVGLDPDYDVSGSDPLDADTTPTPMLIGHGFQGGLDELKVAALVATEMRKLPKNTEVHVNFGGSPDGRIHFDGEGKLDIRFHSRIVRFRVRQLRARFARDQTTKKVDLTRTVQVNWLGGVEVGDTERTVDE